MLLGFEFFVVYRFKLGCLYFLDCNFLVVMVWYLFIVFLIFNILSLLFFFMFFCFGGFMFLKIFLFLF